MSVLGLVWQEAWLLTLVVSIASITAVWLPLTKGTRLAWRARRATGQGGRVVDSARAAQNGERAPLPQMLREVYEETERESAGEHAPAFVRDAAKQLVLTEYEIHFSNPISMYANILPPIGFIGTTAGLVVLFTSMHVTSEPMRLSGLALALSSTIFGLVGYAFLEALKIHLYGRVVRCVEDGIRLMTRAGA